MLILESQLRDSCLLRFLEVRRNDVEVGWRCEVMTLHEQLLAIVHQVNLSEIIPRLSELLQLALPINSIQVDSSMPYANEIEHDILRATPYEILNAGVETLCDVFFLASGCISID